MVLINYLVACTAGGTRMSYKQISGCRGRRRWGQGQGTGNREVVPSATGAFSRDENILKSLMVLAAHDAHDAESHWILHSENAGSRASAPDRPHWRRRWGQQSSGPAASLKLPPAFAGGRHEVRFVVSVRMLLFERRIL